MSVGIGRISFYTSNFYLDLKTLAARRDVDPNYFYNDLGQEKMAVCSPDQDIITLAAAAAKPIIDSVDKNKIRTVIFCTETGIDQSKAAAIYVHKLLGLSNNCRVIEMKQACYSASFALSYASNYVKSHPDEQVLIIAADIAKYGIDTAGEPTQGAGAVAMLIKADPEIFEYKDQSGFYTEDAMDFWRPNYSETAFVDGKSSIRLYLKSMINAWQDLVSRNNVSIDDFDYFCFHLPFTTMSVKALKKLAKVAEYKDIDFLNSRLLPSLEYNKNTGNCYTGSLYQGLTCLTDNVSNLDNNNILCFSYGSGCIAEFFTLKVVKGYREYLFSNDHKKLISNRTELTFEEYQKFYEFKFVKDGTQQIIDSFSNNNFKLKEINNHKRIYACE